jgi:hypothetical protein
MIRLFADADLNEGMVAGCSRGEPTMNFRSANDANLEGVPDPEVLALADGQDRILVSHDFSDHAAVFRRFPSDSGFQSRRDSGAAVFAHWGGY